MNKQELNNAIYEVITNKLKKDCPEAHKTVKKAGYKIEKWDGVFHIRNNKTNRCISITRPGRYIKATRIKFNPYLTGAKLNRNFDFVNCLETPVNIDMYQMPITTPTIEKYEKLQSKKRYVKYHKDSLEEARKKLEKAIADYEWQIKHHTKCLEEAENDLVAIKEKLGIA